MKRMLIVGLLVTLAVAGFASYYASSDPDGLTSVSQTHGFADTEKQSVTNDSPLAGYDTAGVDNDRVSGGVAGVLGSLLVLVLGAGLFFGLRRT